MNKRENSLNRHERRKQKKLLRLGNRALKLRCSCCDKAGKKMNDEHFFPRWLIKYADVRRDGINWLGKKGVNPERATIPLCVDCNHFLGAELENPMARIFRDLDEGKGATDKECEIIVKWMWKMEGLAWQLLIGSKTHSQYTVAGHTLKERVTGSTLFDQVREDLVLALALIEENDEEFEDWPLGLDTPLGLDQAICVGGVFGRIAVITSLLPLADKIPDIFTKHEFKSVEKDKNDKVCFPKLGFKKASDAIETTTLVSIPLAHAHEELGKRMRENQKLIIPPKPKIELPPM